MDTPQSAPKPQDPNALPFTPDQLDAELNEVLNTEAETLEKQAEQYEQAHALLQQALQEK